MILLNQPTRVPNGIECKTGPLVAFARSSVEVSSPRLVRRFSICRSERSGRTIDCSRAQKLPSGLFRSSAGILLSCHHFRVHASDSDMNTSAVAKYPSAKTDEKPHIPSARPPISDPLLNRPSCQNTEIAQPPPIAAPINIFSTIKRRHLDTSARPLGADSGRSAQVIRPWDFRSRKRTSGKSPVRPFNPPACLTPPRDRLGGQGLAGRLLINV
jgi:hypothetical protein